MPFCIILDSKENECVNLLIFLPFTLIYGSSFDVSSKWHMSCMDHYNQYTLFLLLHLSLFAIFFPRIDCHCNVSAKSINFQNITSTIIQRLSKWYPLKDFWVLEDLVEPTFHSLHPSPSPCVGGQRAVGTSHLFLSWVR